MYKMSDELKDWMISVFILVIIVPGILKLVLSLFMEIDVLQCWGLVSLGIVIFSGYEIIRDETDPNIDEEDDQDDW